MFETNTLTKTHPLTGLPIVPVGYRKNGRPIWPIMGGSDDAGGDAGDTGDAGDKTGDDAGDAGTADDQTGGDKTGDAGDKTEDTPAVIKALRDDFKTERTKRQEAETKQTDLIQKLGKALGLVDGDKTPTVEALTEQLTEQTSKTESASAVARDTQAELVVWQNATDLGVDAGALTDSRAFAAAIQNLDPTDSKFVADVKKAAQAAAEKNPKLKSDQASGSSSADHSGGPGGSAPRKVLPMADAVASTLGK